MTVASLLDLVSRLDELRSEGEWMEAVGAVIVEWVSAGETEASLVGVVRVWLMHEIDTAHHHLDFLSSFLLFTSSAHFCYYYFYLFIYLYFFFFGHEIDYFILNVCLHY